MDKIKEYVIEVILHKQLVLEASKILISYLLDNGESKKAKILLERCIVHDNSKFSDEEMDALIRIKDKEDLKNPNVLLDEDKVKAISTHWKNNSHHPEYHNTVEDMSDIDLMEMACDCYARSLQFNTDFLSFIETRQKIRFKFPESVFNKYYNYCLILDKNNNKVKQFKNL